MSDIIPFEIIESKIQNMRNQKVILDQDLAELYGVETKTLNRAVKRNSDRFPVDFMFQLTREEFNNLRCHFVTSNWGGRRYPPYAFTELGIAMLSSVLNSDRAIQINIQIMRVFTKLRGMLREYDELKEFIISLAKKQQEDVTFIFMELDRLNKLFESLRPKRQIGFQASDDNGK